MAQLAEIVNSSASCNHAQALTGCDFHWRSWAAFFTNYFTAVKGIRTIHHIHFDAAAPGVITVKKSVDDQPQEIRILATSVDALLAAGMPPVLPAGGLSHDRQAYLYRQIRPHVPAEFQDTLCPQPASAEAEEEVND